MTKAYIAGKMTGEPRFGFDLFDAAARCLAEYGWTVFSPADMDRKAGLDPNKSFISQEFLQSRFRDDMVAIGNSDAIVLLENWTRSPGARHEAQTSLFCGHDFYLYNQIEDSISRLTTDAIRDELSKPIPPPPPPFVIGLGHYARVGKDEVADYLVEKYGFHKQGYTDTINAVLHDTCEGIAKIVDEIGWEEAKDRHPWIRTRQQALGASVRNHVGMDTWVNAVASQWEGGRRYVIKNVRFPNECKSIQSAGGKVARVDRPGFGPVNSHFSEIALADWDGWDAVITNNMGPPEVYAATEALMKKYGIKPTEKVDTVPSIV